MPDMPTYNPKTAHISTQIALDPSIFAAAAALQGIFPVVYVENYDDLQWGQLLTSGVPHPAGWRKTTQQEV